jgi:hypothetical protein
MLRTLLLCAVICLALGLGMPAMADCPGDCSIEAGICVASWYAWDGVCEYSASQRHDSAIDGCNYYCTSPCDPDSCRAAADVDYAYDSATCDGTAYSGEQDCGTGYAECLAQCVG